MKTNDERTKFESLMKAGGFSVTMYGNVYIDETVQRARSIWVSLMPDQNAGDATPIGYIDLNARSASTAFAWAKYRGPAGNKTMPVYAAPPMNSPNAALSAPPAPADVRDGESMMRVPTDPETTNQLAAVMILRDAEDAKRYRWLRQHISADWVERFTDGFGEPEELDAKIDEQIALQAGK